MTTAPEKLYGPCQKFFPLGCLMALGSAARAGNLYRNGQIHFSGIFQLLGAMVVGYVICVAADKLVISRQIPRNPP